MAKITEPKLLQIIRLLSSDSDENIAKCKLVEYLCIEYHTHLFSNEIPSKIENFLNRLMPDYSVVNVSDASLADYVMTCSKENLLLASRELLN